ncbi:MAG: TIGR04076 family protein [candidate division WOR-3 bacterium]|nr:MAG: TIGR04076 family protein [candidate division WOR-3 bacterium]
MTIKITIINGVCQGDHHTVGQEFIVEHTTPAGMCLGAWNASAPYVSALRFGGNFPWEKEEGVATIHCPDPKGITLELRRVK